MNHIKFYFLHVMVIIFGLVFLSLMLWNGSKIYSMFIEQADTARHFAPESLPIFTVENNNIASAREIAQWNLFGQVQSKQISGTSPKTRLRLKLIGVIGPIEKTQSQHQGRHSITRVIIENKSKKQRYYKVGDSIAANATISAIYPAHIVIEHNGKEEMLLLESRNDKKLLIKKLSKMEKNKVL